MKCHWTRRFVDTRIVCQNSVSSLSAVLLMLECFEMHVFSTEDLEEDRDVAQRPAVERLKTREEALMYLNKVTPSIEMQMWTDLWEKQMSKGKRSNGLNQPVD